MFLFNFVNKVFILDNWWYFLFFDIFRISEKLKNLYDYAIQLKHIRLYSILKLLHQIFWTRLAIITKIGGCFILKLTEYLHGYKLFRALRIHKYFNLIESVKLGRGFFVKDIRLVWHFFSRDSEITSLLDHESG